jgi:hypothetical protein
VTNRRFVACLSLWLALAFGCATPAAPTASIQPSAGPTIAGFPAASPSGAASSLPASQVTTLGTNAQPHGAGTYRLDLSVAPTVLDATFPAVLVTVPDGWNNLNGWGFMRGSGAHVAVQFWNVDQVYGHPCQWKGTLSRPGPTVDDLVNALIKVPMRNPTQPIDVTLSRTRGTYLEWSVPSDMKFSDCDADDGAYYFESWTAHGGEGDRYHQGPGQVDRLWILDVKGSRLVIDAFSMPSATEEEIQELVGVVNSIEFER